MTDTSRRRLLERRADGKPAHPYRKAVDTDIGATFARIRREQAKQQKAATVTPIKRSAK